MAEKEGAEDTKDTKSGPKGSNVTDLTNTDNEAETDAEGYDAELTGAYVSYGLEDAEPPTGLTEPEAKRALNEKHRMLRASDKGSSARHQLQLEIVKTCVC